MKPEIKNKCKTRIVDLLYAQFGDAFLLTQNFLFTLYDATHTFSL